MGVGASVPVVVDDDVAVWPEVLVEDDVGVKVTDWEALCVGLGVHVAAGDGDAAGSIFTTGS